ncbi:MAG: flavohemoprotein [Oscillatoria sp. SIO1A7]|nr:flavohemoprotein [Oscillatoria sp. SIO1A7]
MSLDVKNLEESFELVKPKADEFATSFYETLFADNPGADKLFEKTDMAKQKKMLVASLVLVVENLRKPDALTDTLKKLGARHVNYGTLEEHYPLVGGALLKTFESYLGDKWTPEVKKAWEEAYGTIADIMLKGAAEAEGAKGS